ncbi:MAG: hypothetical protein ACRDPA_00165, partial [Solirubrobacteraceae bacterium]
MRSHLVAGIAPHGAAFTAWLSYDESRDPSDVSAFEGAYRGEWDSPRAYAEDYAEQAGMYDAAEKSGSSYVVVDIDILTGPRHRAIQRPLRSEHGLSSTRPSESAYFAKRVRALDCRVNSGGSTHYLSRYGTFVSLRRHKVAFVVILPLIAVALVGIFLVVP